MGISFKNLKKLGIEGNLSNLIKDINEKSAVNILLCSEITVRERKDMTGWMSLNLKFLILQKIPW